jgi:tetratricopeptide (TPR) repeat protein
MIHKRVDSDPQKGRFSAYYQRGTHLLMKGETAKAVPLLEKAVALEPTHLDAALNLSGAYILTKKFRQATAVLEPLRDDHAQNPMLWTNLGASYLGNPVLAREEEQVQAIAAFERAYELNPATPHVAYNIGLIYRDRREADKAIFWFQRAVQANPQDADAQRLIQKLSGANRDA